MEINKKEIRESYEKLIYLNSQIIDIKNDLYDENCTLAMFGLGKIHEHFEQALKGCRVAAEDAGIDLDEDPDDE